MTPLLESLQRALTAGTPGGPAWLREGREHAAAYFRAAGLPHTKLEEWRFTSLQGLLPSALVRAGAGAAGDVAALAELDRIPAGEARLVLVNGRLREELSSRGQLPSAVVATSLARAWTEQPELVRGRLGRCANVEQHPFVALNTALLEDGVLLQVPAGTVLADPIHLVFATDAPGAASMSHPRVLVIAGEGARFTVAEHWLGRGDELYVANGVAELFLADGAEVEHYTLQTHGAGAFHFGALFAEQGAGAKLKLHALALGAQLSRSEIHARLGGEGATIDLTGLTMLGGSQLSDVHSVVEHAKPRCETVESYKAILDGHSRGVFAGRIRVLPGAQKTQAYQQSSSLLLSEDALIDTMPQLEIFADDVKCGHGGSVGQLDASALFYLRTRGLDEGAARNLLIYGFASEMVDRVRPAALRERARAHVAARLPGGPTLLEAA
jgi:Fe-S cluster assembly protein SufD